LAGRRRNFGHDQRTGRASGDVGIRPGWTLEAGDDEPPGAMQMLMLSGGIFSRGWQNVTIPIAPVIKSAMNYAWFRAPRLTLLSPRSLMAPMPATAA